MVYVCHNTGSFLSVIEIRTGSCFTENGFHDFVDSTTATFVTATVAPITMGIGRQKRIVFEARSLTEEGILS